MPRYYERGAYGRMVLCYGMANMNAAEAQDIYVERFPDLRKPTQAAIIAAWQRASENDNASPRNEMHLPNERVRPVRDAAREQVEEMFREDGTTSTRVVARARGISQSTTWRIVRKDMGFRPFHYRKAHTIG